MAGKAGAGRVLHPGFSLTYPNLTPDRETGAGSWSDEEIYRALTRGIGHDGRVLYTEMPMRNCRSFLTRTSRRSSCTCDLSLRYGMSCRNRKSPRL